MKIYTGEYTGNGIDNTKIHVAGMDETARLLVMIVADANVSGVWRFADMAGDKSTEMGDNKVEETNLIQGYGNDGNPYFEIGSGIEVNNNGTNYQYIVIEDDGTADVFFGTYSGDGNDDRNITDVAMGFTPELLFVKSAGARRGRVSITGLGDNSLYLTNVSGGAADGIQALAVKGFQLGQSSSVKDIGGETYYYAAFDQVAGFCDVGNYTGDGNDPRVPAITTVGFQADWVAVKGDRTSYPVIHTHDIGDAVDDSYPYFGGGFANAIESLDADGFSLGNDVTVNENTTDYYWFAFLEGDTGAAGACDTLVHSCDDSTAGTYALGSNAAIMYRATKFTAPAAATICRIDVLLEKNGSPVFGVTAGIWGHDAVNDEPEITDQKDNSDALDSSTFPADGSPDWVTFSSNLSAAITNGGTFWVVLISSAVDASNYVDWHFDDCAVERILIDNDGAAWVLASVAKSMMYRLYEGAAGGLSIPVAMHHYKQLAGA